MPHPQRILVPLDVGESAGSPAVAAARSWATRHGAKILLLHVVPTDELHLLRAEYDSDQGGADELHAKEVSQQRLEDIAATIRKDGVRCDVLVVSGSPTERIAEIARDEKVDLVILAQRRQGSRIREWLLGGTTYAVVRRLDCDVLVVRSR